MKKPKPAKKSEPSKDFTEVDVVFRPAKPNKMFTEYQRRVTWFLHFTKPVKCAYCGRMGKHHWTQLKFFRIAEGFEMKLPNGKVVACQSFSLKPGMELFPPITPVCSKHILQPEME